MRRRRDFWDGFFDEFFFDIEDEIRRIEEQVEREFRELEKEFRYFDIDGKPIVYGFTMHVGPDGKPQIREFGNVLGKVGSGKPLIEEVGFSDFMVDVFEDEDSVSVLAELPGEREENIDVHLAGDDEVVIRAKDGKYKRVKLPCKVKRIKDKSYKKSGVLTVVLEKA